MKLKTVYHWENSPQWQPVLLCNFLLTKLQNGQDETSVFNSTEHIKCQVIPFIMHLTTKAWRSPKNSIHKIEVRLLTILVPSCTERINLDITQKKNPNSPMRSQIMDVQSLASPFTAISDHHSVEWMSDNTSEVIQTLLISTEEMTGHGALYGSLM